VLNPVKGGGGGEPKRERKEDENKSILPTLSAPIFVALKLEIHNVEG
jgi:hypothetical protein